MRVVGVVVALVVLGGCTGDRGPDPDPAPGDAGVVTSGAAATPVQSLPDAGAADADETSGGLPSAAPATSADVLDDPAAADAVFLTAVDEVVAGTALDGVVDADPGGFLVLATTICDLLDDGVDVDELLDATLDVLGATSDGGDVETATLAGGVVGAAVEVYCRRHAAAVAGIEGRR